MPYSDVYKRQLFELCSDFSFCIHLFKRIFAHLTDAFAVYDYMIDGIINNGPKEEKTAAFKAPETGEKSSIMDRLKSAKAEKQKDCCPPQKHKGEIEL